MTSLALASVTPAPTLPPSPGPGAMPSVPAHPLLPPSTTTGDSTAPDNPTTDPGQRTTDQAARNRANAAKSTGPRTPAGKLRSSQNARTHGLTSSTPPTNLPVPDPCAQLEYTTALVELRKEHRPATPSQHALVNQLALVLWKLDYIPRLEHRLLNTPLPDADDLPQPNPAHITPHPRLDHDLDPTARVLAAHFTSDRPTPLTRLFNYHHRLQARLNSLLNQLRRLKRDPSSAPDDDTYTTPPRPNARWHLTPDIPPATLSEISNLQLATPEPSKTCQSAPNHATPPRASAPAQNEPTPGAPPSRPVPPDVPSTA